MSPAWRLTLFVFGIVLGISILGGMIYGEYLVFRSSEYFEEGLNCSNSYSFLGNMTSLGSLGEHSTLCKCPYSYYASFVIYFGHDIIVDQNYSRCIRVDEMNRYNISKRYRAHDQFDLYQICESVCDTGRCENSSSCDYFHFDRQTKPRDQKLSSILFAFGIIGLLIVLLYIVILCDIINRVSLKMKKDPDIQMLFGEARGSEQVTYATLQGEPT